MSSFVANEHGFTVGEGYMHNVIMSSLNGQQEKIAFNMQNILQIITSSEAKTVSSGDELGLAIDLGGRFFPVKGLGGKKDLKPYFILHRSGDAYNVEDYQLLFNVREVSENRISGKDVNGNEYLCKRQGGESFQKDILKNLSFEEIEEKVKTVDSSMGELKELKDMISKLKSGEFYESLTMEFSGKVKEIAQELIDFRKDIQARIEPEIVEMAAKDIPEASSQLEGINETLESSTMKIMDINEEQMELANKRLEILTSLISENGHDGEAAGKAMRVVEEDVDVLKKLGSLSMSMMEPLSFQDLVGQRIQKIIKLVKSMEFRIEDLVISFGIKIQRHRENPERSFEDLRKDVENYKSELKGPQNEGEGLDQSDIDDLLAAL